MFQEDIFGDTPARAVSPTQLTLDEQLPICLHEHGKRLRCIAQISSSATRRPLEDEIERIEEMLEALDASHQQKEVTQ